MTLQPVLPLSRIPSQPKTGFEPPVTLPQDLLPQGLRSLVTDVSPGSRSGRAAYAGRGIVCVSRLVRRKVNYSRFSVVVVFRGERR